MTVYIVGAGLSGLACAIQLVSAGKQVILFEATHQAGGRCRSFYDNELKCYLDNGTHLIIGANTQTLRYITSLGSNNRFIEVAPAVFPFFDIANRECWVLRPNSGRLPWWVLRQDRRVAGSRFIDYLLSAYRLFVECHRKQSSTATVDSCLNGHLMRRLWKPLTEATLNTDPADASAILFARVILKTLGKGECSCRPYIARHSLGQALVDPALVKILVNGGRLCFGSRLRSINSYHCNYTEKKIGLKLCFSTGTIETHDGDSVVLALPPWSIAALWPQFPVPRVFQAIVNVHYHLNNNRMSSLPNLWPPFLGIVGGVAQWLFLRRNILSVTVSAANTLITQDCATIASNLWNDSVIALSLSQKPMPPSRVIKEKRATPIHTPFYNKQTSLTSSPLPGVILAGDWTCPDLPATIEAAVTSGFLAAELILKSHKKKSS